MAAAAVYRLRRDLELLPAEVGADGGATWLLRDPLSSAFDGMEWPEYEIVSRLRAGGDLDGLHAALRRETTLRLSRRELERFVETLERRGFLDSGRFDSVEALTARRIAARPGWAKWLLGHYLYFRLPLIRPDAFLEKTLWLPRLLGSDAAKGLFAVLAVVAAYLFLTRLELLYHSVVLFLSWKNAVWAGLAVVAVKTIHEFSHAYAAKARGVRVAAMGVAFMVLFPLPYCDVTDAWRLPRRQRLAISFAGVRSELVLAVFAFLGWTVAEAGAIKDIFLVLCTGSIVSTLLTNLNPGMRFDGYYLLSDCLGIDNLQSRAFGYFRRTVRRCLGMRLAEPEAALAGWRKAAMLAYTLYAWLYRLGLYFGIAVAVYLYFPKVIGIALFALEITAFLVRPVYCEIRDVWRMRRLFRTAVGPILCLVLLAGLAFWFICPLPRRIALPAAAVAVRTATLYAPWDGDVALLPPEKGEQAREGEPLFRLETALTEFELQRIEWELQEARTLLRYASGRGELREDLQRETAREKRLLAARDASRARLDGNRLVAPFSGVVVDADETLRPGLSVHKGKYIATLADNDAGVKIAAYVSEQHRKDVAPGKEAWFTPDSDPGVRVPCSVTLAEVVNAGTIGEPFMAERYGGRVVTDGRPDGLRPAETVYRVEALPLSPGENLRHGQAGVLYMRSGPRSHAAEALRRLAALAVRESGF